MSHNFAAMAKLPKQFYTGTDTLEIAKQLLGTTLCSNFNGIITKGKIVETEAYCGIEDRGCHAFKGRLTDRTKVMYQPGGVVYVYLCYGIHYLFNVITHIEGMPHAILIRAIEPIAGFEMILERTNRKKIDHTIGAGPGLVSLCMGFKKEHTGISLLSDEIWIDKGASIPKNKIIDSPRVGMNFEGEYKLIPWRFRIKDSIHISKAK
jgi:DNA-3-methyladenine glycosylase